MIKKILALIGIKHEIKFSKIDMYIVAFLIILLILFLIREVYNITKLNTKSEIVSTQTQCVEQICMFKDGALECFTLQKPEYFTIKIYKNAYTKGESYGYIFESKNKPCE